MLIRSADEAVISLLELVASEHEELVPWMLDFLAHSPARESLLDVVKRWEVSESGDLETVAIQGARDLNRFERKRHWKKTDDVVSDPHLVSLADLAGCRAARIEGVARRRRLEASLRKIKSTLDLQQVRKQLEEFLSPQEGSPGIDPDWIERFIESGS